MTETEVLTEIKKLFDEYQSNSSPSVAFDRSIKANGVFCNRLVIFLKSKEVKDVLDKIHPMYT